MVAAACGSDSDDAGSATTAGSDDGGSATTAGSDDGGSATDDGGDDGTMVEGGELNVAIVQNPQMEDIVALTPELYTADSGVTVNYTILPENELREITTRDVATEGTQFDVVMIGLYEAPQFGEAGWLAPITEQAANDAGWNQADVFEPILEGLTFDGELYAAPFYAESSFLNYRMDVFEDQGLTMPERPTWDEVDAFARQIEDSGVMNGICLRGVPGWGNQGAAFTTVLNTFGGTWWAANDDGSIGESQVDQPEFREALEFYISLTQEAGVPDPLTVSFPECQTLMKEGQVAMWYDATSAASGLEATDSDVAGLIGYVPAPVKVTDNSGWLWAWSLAIAETSEQKDAAWDYISWATSAEYIAAAGELIDGGWANIPPGTRESTYAIEAYRAVAPFADPTLQAMAEAPIDMPGTTPRPGIPGVQFVGVPEFQEVGNFCTERFGEVIGSGNLNGLDDAIAACHEFASRFSS
jgi:sorbitol/mannitol transport system substrate-binding protein